MRHTVRQKEFEFFGSVQALDSEITPTTDILPWIAEQKARAKAFVQQIPLDRMRQWRFHEATGNIVHESGKYFSVEGIRINTNWGRVPEWEQPIINQPEIGYLAILTQKKKGILHFLMQAKVEPGNLNVVQLSPTLQATKSNYTKVHKGSTPLFLDYFRGGRRSRVLLDQLQSEQGARFLKKRNRNMIIEVDENEDVAVPDGFIWLTLGQLKALMRHDNIVNMDSRSVLSAIPFGGKDIEGSSASAKSLFGEDGSLNSFDDIITWMTELKIRYSLDVERIPLKNVGGWSYNGLSIVHEGGRYFEVMGANISIEGREVISWDQPMVKPVQEGILAFIVKRFSGVCHFLVQAKLEAGNFDILEMAPTVQCLTGDYRPGHSEYHVPFIEEVLTAPAERIWYAAMQSEEGGRFYKEQNRNMIIEAGADFPENVPENFCWLTLPQMLTFLKFNNYLNIAARSLISAVSF